MVVNNDTTTGGAMQNGWITHQGPCTPYTHEWRRYQENKPYPHAPKLYYHRTIAECVRCGRKNGTAWGRGLRPAAWMGRRLPARIEEVR